MTGNKQVLGFTLIELIVALAFLSIIIVAASSLYVFAARTNASAWAKTNDNYETYSIVERGKSNIFSGVSTPDEVTVSMSFNGVSYPIRLNYVYEQSESGKELVTFKLTR